MPATIRVRITLPNATAIADQNYPIRLHICLPFWPAFRLAKCDANLGNDFCVKHGGEFLAILLEVYLSFPRNITVSGGGIVAKRRVSEPRGVYTNPAALVLLTVTCERQRRGVQLRL